MTASAEEQFIAKHLAPLTSGFPGAFGLRDDCAEWRPLSGHALILKTDPIVEGVHFFPEDAPEDLAWKALAVNVSDLAAKAARPAAYLMALTLPAAPNEDWIMRFARGLSDAQSAFGCQLIGGDTDQRDGPLSIAITIIGEAPAGQMVKRGGAQIGDAVYVTGELGGASLGLQLRLGKGSLRGISPSLISEEAKQAALARYLRPSPKLGLRAALRAHAHSAMDISDGLIKDLDRMCRLGDVGANLDLAAIPLTHGLSALRTVDPTAAARLATAGDDYEVLATVAERDAQAFESIASKGGVQVTRIGDIVAAPGVRVAGLAVNAVAEMTGYDHFDKNSRG